MTMCSRKVTDQVLDLALNIGVFPQTHLRLVTARKEEGNDGNEHVSSQHPQCCFGQHALLLIIIVFIAIAARTSLWLACTPSAWHSPLSRLVGLRGAGVDAATQQFTLL